ncbi:hypothetical protein I203_106431 [Kwoniella mangroviensis CBS 8507]|uniref:uncharacterized protein n=1 Tax=Kwoniella mangroviensis CBS 8507 TaxID=1296122 RepID=UPI00080D1933|nr:uncharacterized protein I203_07707 [Kwoniella mangroviensis CBS 8507]OCF63282.1 hypothetical protein I203_07707 [Kwoniella mangroviensis CBS 8507]
MSSPPTTAPASAKNGPSPIENFQGYLPHLTQALDNLTNHAANLPSKSDLSFHRTLDKKFATDLDSASERILKLTERLLDLVDKSQQAQKNPSNQLPKIDQVKVAKIKGKGKGTINRRKLGDEDDVVDGFKQSVMGVVDGLLEDADSCLDEVSGQKKKAAIAVKPHLAAQAGQKLPGPFSKQAARLPQNILHASDIPKPQLLFHEPIDNTPTTSPWRPKLSSKPHSMVPLDFVPALDYSLSMEEELDPSKEYWRREREIRLRQHPYYYETKHLPYPTSLFINSPPVKPKSFQDTPFQFVDTPEQLVELTEILRRSKEIAVDLEHHNMRSYSGFTCLIQISTREGDWVIDALKLRKELKEDKLGDVFTNPGIIKVFHGSDSDIVWLQHDFEIFVVNLFDTYHATVVLQYTQRSLASLLKTYCNFEADKRYQMADWRIRPLPEGMLHYARSDTHFLLYIYDNLRNSLLEQSSRPPSPDPNGNPVIEVTRRNPQQAMREVLGRSEDTALKMYEIDEYNEETGKGTGGWMGAAKKWLNKTVVDEEPGWVWRKLHAWRDRLGRELDESPIFIMPQDILKNLALLRGTAPILIKQAINPDRAPIAAARLEEIGQIIKQAKAEWQANQLEESQKAAGLEEAARIKKQGIIQKQQQKMLESQPKPIPDVWDAITVPGPSATTSSSTKSSKNSGLFGSTIKSSSSSSTSTPSSSKVVNSSKLTSSLFGSTIVQQGKGRKPRNTNRKNKELSPGFENVQNSIHGELQSTKQAVELLVPEQVPYVPPTERGANMNEKVNGNSSTTTISKTEDKEDIATGAQPVPIPVHSKKEEGGIVQVKKSRKPKRERGASSSLPSTSGVGSTNGTENVIGGKKVKLDTTTDTSTPNGNGEQVIKSKKEKKTKKVIKPDEIPDFDYSSMPNILDQPDSAMGKEGKEKKKKRKDKKGGNGGIGAIEAPTFGARAARDMSQPKGGNKSGTFT